jgi:ABC-type iron transport system FetAB permease component
MKNQLMNKNLVHTISSERKRIKPSHELTSTKKHSFKCAIKESITLRLITFLKEMYHLDTY